MVEISEILAILAKKRPIFHSEADFQHAFAWEIQQKLPNASVRLELPIQVENQFLHIDVWVAYQDQVLAVELKYKTRALSVEVDGEQYRLKSQSAQDVGRYDFIKDIQRLERISTASKNFDGYAVLLTNDSAYWIKPANVNSVDANFRINDGRILEGVFNWAENTSIGTKKNREQPLVLNKKQLVRWETYSQPSLGSYGLFRSLTIKVTPPSETG
jgi:hypothetical protein